MAQQTERTAVSVWRKIVSGVGIALLIFGIAATPTAVLTGWIEHSLMNTNNVVASFAPLAKNTSVQKLIVTKSSEQIIAQLQIDKMRRTTSARIEAMDLPKTAKAALKAKQLALIDDIETVVDAAVTDIVHSETFANSWSAILRASQEDAVKTLLSSADVGTTAAPGVGVQVGPIAEAVVAQLKAQKVVFANLLPTKFHYIVPILSDAQVSAARPLAKFSDRWADDLAMGSVASLVLGFLLVRRRLVKLFWTSTAVLVLMALIVALTTTLGNTIAELATGGNFGDAAPIVMSTALRPLWPVVWIISGAAAIGLVGSGIVLAIRRRHRPHDSDDDAVGLGLSE